MFKKIMLVLLLLVVIFAAHRPGDRHARKPVPEPPNYGPLLNQIQDYLAGQPGTYGLYFSDLVSGREFGYNALTPFHAASTFKLPMNLYLYRQADRGVIDLKEQLTLEERHLEGGTGILKNEKTGTIHSIAQLAEYSIIHSDNIATNMLLEKLERKRVKNFMRTLGAKVVSDEANTTCPYDLFLYMRETIEFSRSNSLNSTLLLNHLFNSRHKERIPAPLPEGTRVANKVGTWPPEHTYNDVAYVVHPQRPYILAITSKDTPGYGEALVVIRHLSKMVYDYQSSISPRGKNPA